jgi:hypothetical protein
MGDEKKWRFDYFENPYVDLNGTVRVFIQWKEGDQRLTAEPEDALLQQGGTCFQTLVRMFADLATQKNLPEARAVLLSLLDYHTAKGDDDPITLRRLMNVYLVAREPVLQALTTTPAPPPPPPPRQNSSSSSNSSNSNNSSTTVKREPGQQKQRQRQRQQREQQANLHDQRSQERKIVPPAVGDQHKVNAVVAPDAAPAASAPAAVLPAAPAPAQHSQPQQQQRRCFQQPPRHKQRTIVRHEGQPLQNCPRCQQHLQYKGLVHEIPMKRRRLLCCQCCIEYHCVLVFR